MDNPRVEEDHTQDVVHRVDTTGHWLEELAQESLPVALAVGFPEVSVVSAAGAQLSEMARLAEVDASVQVLESLVRL